MKYSVVVEKWNATLAAHVNNHIANEEEEPINEKNLQAPYC